MPKTKKTDLQVLRALLSMPLGKLSSSEKTSFQAMFDQLSNGRQVKLSEKQRGWADSVYDKHDLDKPRAEGARPVAVKDKSAGDASPLDNLPKPLRPPGK